jgi:hypothetical protein
MTTWKRISTNIRDRRVVKKGTRECFKVKDIVERAFGLHTSVMPVGPQEQHCAQSKASSSKVKSVKGRAASRAPSKETDADYDDYEEIPCQECGKKDHGEHMVLCDTCDCGYHIHCLKPRLKKVPTEDEEWTCANCKMDFFAKNVFFCDDEDFPKSLTTQMDVIFIESSSTQTKWFDEIDDKSLLDRISCVLIPSGRPKFMELIDLESFVVLQSSKCHNAKASQDENHSGPWDYGSVKKLGLRFRDETGAYCLPDAVDGVEVKISWSRGNIKLKGDCYHTDSYLTTKIGCLPDCKVTKSTKITVAARLEQGTPIRLEHLLKMQHGEPAGLLLKLEKNAVGSSSGDDSDVRVHEMFGLMIEVQDAHLEKVLITDDCKLEMKEFYFKDSHKLRNDVESQSVSGRVGEQQWGPCEAEFDKDKGVFTIHRCRFQGKAGKGRLIMKAQLVCRDVTKDLESELSLKLVAGEAKMVTLKEPLLTADPKRILISREAPDLKRIRVQVTDVSQNLVHWKAGVQLNFTEPTRRAASSFPFVFQDDFSYILDLKIADFEPAILQKGNVIEAQITPGGPRGRFLEAQQLSFLVEASNRVEKISQQLSNSEAVFSNETFKAKVTLATEDNKSLPQLCRRACAIILWKVGQTAEKRLTLKECRNVKWHEQDNTVSFEIPANLVNGNSTAGNNNVSGGIFYFV